MKPGRQGIILEIIEKQNIETQTQLQEALAERGVSTTQATLSRDIRDLRLIKEPTENGRTRYVKARCCAEHSRCQNALRSGFGCMLGD